MRGGRSRHRRGVLAAALVMSLAACGDDAAAPYCVAVDGLGPPYDPYCRLTWHMATEASSELILTQADYDAAYARLWPIWAADEPMLRFACPMTSLPVFRGELSLQSANSEVIDALEQRVSTGDAALDEVLAELPIKEQFVDRFAPEWGGGGSVLYTFARPVGSAVLRDRLDAQDTVEYRGFVANLDGHDVVWEEGPDGGQIAHVTISIGSEIPFTHSWDVELHPDGTSTVIDRGGDTDDLEVLRDYALRELPLPPPPPGW